MDRNDQQAIENLFGKLSKVESQVPERDGDAERFIRDRINSQPAAPYYMAQTIVVQEQALEKAQQRIAELEAQNVQSLEPAQPQRGGMFSSMFGSNAAPDRTAVAGSAARPSPWGQRSSAQPTQQRGGGGGFLAGAAQTAVGVAGGMMLGNAIMGMFGADEAQAATPAPETPAETPVEDVDDGGDLGMDDMEF
ncbi:DUF2076 domain-containing protein [Agrobacterium sp. rho-8.1]|nr:DUF2076 domain-containing protein [Agrobacterium sp. rho-8.1]